MRDGKGERDKEGQKEGRKDGGWLPLLDPDPAAEFATGCVAECGTPGCGRPAEFYRWEGDGARARAGAGAGARTRVACGECAKVKSQDDRSAEGGSGTGEGLA